VLVDGRVDLVSFSQGTWSTVRRPRSTGQAQNGRHLSLAGPPRLLAPSIHWESSDFNSLTLFR
jgi:hypothetical protein